MTVLNVLLIDDDPESLSLLMDSLPVSVAGATIRWEDCGTFEGAFERIATRRFDIVVTDIYRDRTSPRKDLVTGDPQGKTVLEEILERRFCPVLLFTDGAFPEEPKEGPFVKIADKSSGNDQLVDKLRELIGTGIPELAHRIHDELDSASGSYLWNFLKDNWSSLEAGGLTQPAVLDRLIHRRAAVQFGRLQVSEDGAFERPFVEGAEFYLSPRIAPDLRLGQILEHQGEYRVVLTPHCHLVVQPQQESPRTDYVLTVKTVAAKYLFAKHPLQGKSEAKKRDDLRRRIQAPAGFGQPAGRYWFLPGFLAMPHLYVDLLQLESLPIEIALNEWESFAVLDVPFAEALQSSFVRFYSAVGLPMLDPSRFADLQLPEERTDGCPPECGHLVRGRPETGRKRLTFHSHAELSGPAPVRPHAAAAQTATAAAGIELPSAGSAVRGSRPRRCLVVNAWRERLRAVPRKTRVDGHAAIVAG